MPKIVFKHPTGGQEELEIAEGTSIMEAATAHGIKEIVGDCGGNCLCATCHVYVEPAQLELLPKITEAEDDLLDTTVCERLPNSRLSCQIIVRPNLDGLIVTLPERQL